MRIICNRFNPQYLVDVMQAYGSKLTLDARWQISVQDKNGKFHDHFFVAKPTRKQISKLHKEHCVYHKAHCYECGKRIKLGDEFSFDDLNYAHKECLK